MLSDLLQQPFDRIDEFPVIPFPGLDNDGSKFIVKGIFCSFQHFFIGHLVTDITAVSGPDPAIEDSSSNNNWNTRSVHGSRPYFRPVPL